MASAATTREIETLAAEIGDKVYMDIAKWHLYLQDAKLHVPLAERFYPMLESGELSRDRVNGVLQEMSVAIGGGKRDIPLVDLIPSAGQDRLMETLEEFKDQL